MRRNVLTNISMENIRKEKIYQCIITDLKNVGVLSKEKAEGLLGYEIPDFLKLPNTLAKEEKKVTAAEAVTKLKAAAKTTTKSVETKTEKE